MTNTKQIPTFTLYGENQDWPMADLLHWESIAARSVIHDWIIKPHRHSNLWQIIYLTQGQANLHIDGKITKAKLPCLLLLPPLCIHGFEFSENVEGHVVTIAAPLIQNIAKQFGDYQNFYRLNKIVLIEQNHQNHLNSIFTDLAQEYQTIQALRDTAIQLCVHQLMLWILRHSQNIKNTKEIPSGQKLFNGFNQLVETHFREQLSLQEYADKLAISTPHLNSLCRRFENKSALQCVHQRLLLEAKRNLIYTAMTATDISIALGFSEPAYFNRFFKRLTGYTPVEFRQAQE